MTGSSDDSEDTIEYGSDQPPMSTRMRLAAVAGACLVAGFAAGDRADISGDGGRSANEAAAAPVAVGAIARSSSASTGFEFELPVFNPSQDEISAGRLALVGLESRLTTTSEPDISPGTWGIVEFKAPADCTTAPPSELSTVRLRVETSSGLDDVEVQLPSFGESALLEYHRAACAPADRLDRGDLTGVWAMQTAYGPETYLEGILLMRFNRDGTYVWDPEGGLFTTDTAAWGRYRINEGLLTVMPEDGYACGPGASSTWRPTVDADDGVLTMLWLRGACPDDGKGSVWIAQRILFDDGLPPAPTRSGGS